MALVGLIEPGTVTKLLHSVAQSKRDSLVLLRRDGQFGHVVFEHGQCTGASMGEMSGQMALETLERWQSGYFSVGKRLREDENEEHIHALLVVASRGPRSMLEAWLKKRGYQVSVVAQPEHALQFVELLEPDVVVMDCVRAATGKSCLDVRVLIRERVSPPPLVVTVNREEKRCGRPNQLCVIDPVEIERVDGILNERWPATRYDAEAAPSAFCRSKFTQEVRRVMAEINEQGPQPSYSAEEPLSLRRRPGVRKSWWNTRQLALAVLTVVVGSGLLWSAVYFVIG